MIVGLLVVIYAAFILQNSTYIVESWDSDIQTFTEGETPFQQYLVGLFGVIMIFLGYRSFRFIPHSERDSKNISEFDLDPEES